jgi:hypothetical protein
MLKVLKDRFYFRASLPNIFGDSGISCSISFALTQNIKGITNLAENGKYYPFFDIEDCTLKECCESLREVQKKYVLSNIYVISDIENSFRGYCWSKVDFKTYLKILLDTEYLDPLFFKYTVKRDKATLRYSKKRDRPPQELIAVLQSYYVPIPKEFEEVTYATGISKEGTMIVLGNGGKVDGLF